MNALIPNIALERIEIVKDGASALYGSDAVAGVVNFITKKDFEGFDMRYSFSTDDESKEGDTQSLEVIFGTRGDRGGAVVSGSVTNRDEIHVGHRYDRFGGSTISGTGQPGRIRPVVGQDIIWAAHGLNPGQQIDANGDGVSSTTGDFPRDPMGNSFGQADVDCEVAAREELAGTLGVAFANNVCIYDYGPFFALQGEESLRKIHVTADYELTSDTVVYMEYASNSSEFDRLNSLNPNAPALEIAPTHLGNIEDAWRRGIEPITVRNNTRMVGLTRYNQDRPIDTFTAASRDDERMLLGVTSDLEFQGRPWTLDVSYAGNQHNSATTQVQDTLSSHMELAINGLGGPECDVVNGTPGEGNLAYATSGGNFEAGQCYYFNPFGNSRWGRDGGRQTDLSLVNPTELYEWLLGRANSDATFRQRVLDGVLAGELFDIGSNPVQLAVGFQRRVEDGRVNVSAALSTNNLDFVFGAQDWNAELTTTAYFAELALPVTDWMDINLAVRYEDFDEIGESTTDPKITVLMRPTDDISFRVSAGSSYRVPSLQQLFGSLTTVANQVDFDGNAAFRASITPGNSGLVPETADNWNIGVSWHPGDGFLQGLAVDIDYYEYDYEDIITRQGSQTLLNADNAAINSYLGANAGSTAADAVAAGVGNRAQVIRDSGGNLVRLLPRFLNANSAEIEGVDLTASYSFDTRWGSWRVGTQLAYVTTYEVDVPNPSGIGSTVFDAVGQRNFGNPVARPLPEYKWNSTLNWTWNNHRAFLIVKHIPEVEDMGRGGTAGFFAAGIGLALGAGKAAEFLDESDEIKPMTTVDIQYTYNFGEVSFLSDTEISVGIQNLTNEEPPWAIEVTAFDPILHDPRGRVYMVRLGGSL